MRQEIENRLIELAKSIEKLTRSLDKSMYSENLKNQIIRASTSAALNYEEAQSAESKNDFIHKTSIVLKELRETLISLKLLSSVMKADRETQMLACQDECNQLIAIFHKTIMTAKTKK